MKEQDLSAVPAHAGKTKEQLINELVGMYQRIAELERLETQRKQPEQEKAAILNSMSELLIFQDLEHRLIWANKAAGESVGLAPEQLVGHHCYKIWHKRSKPCKGCPVAKARETRKPQVGEMITPDGRTWSLQSYPMKDTGGNIVGMVELVLDITDRKHMETKLRDSEERYRCLVENALDGISVYRDSILFANDKLCELLGYSKEELYGMKVATIIAQEDRKRVRRYITNRLAGRKAPTHYETRVLRKDGSIRHIEVAATRIMYKGQPAGQTVLRDITDRKQKEEELRKHREHLEELVKERTAELTVANEELQQEITQRKRTEEALRKAEQEKRAILDSMSEFVVYQDKGMRILWVNKAAGESVGLAPGQLVGRHCYKIWHKRSKPCKGCPVIKAWKTGQIHQAEITTPDGSVGFVRAYPLRDENGEVLGVIEVVLDITQRKRAEEALQASESKYRTLLENLPQKIFHKDKNSVYISCNENLARDLKIKPNEITGKTDYDLVPKELAEKYRADDKRIIESGKIEDIEERYIQDGKEVIIHTVKTPIKDEKGNIVGILGIFWDITERKQAEEALRKYELIISTTPDLMSFVDRNYIYQAVNDAYLKAFKKSREEIVGHSVAELLGTEAFDKEIKGHLDRCLAGEQVHYQDWFDFPDAKRRCMDVTYSPFFKNGNSVSGVVVNARDITEHKRTEEALRQSEEKYRITFEHTGTAMAIDEEDTTISLINAEAEKLTGCKKEEIEGKMSWTSFVHPEDLERVKGYHYARREGKPVPKGYEFRLIDRKGNIKNILLNVDMIPGTKKTIGSLIDISKRKQAEEALRKSEGKYRDLIERMIDVIYTLDTAGNITSANKAVETLLGFKPKQVIGRSFINLIPKEALPQAMADFKQVLKGKEITSETMLVDKDGKPHNVEFSSTPIIKDGKVVGTRGIARDITERKQAEKELQESEAKYRELADLLPQAVFEVDKKGKIKFLNRKALEFCCFTQEDLEKGLNALRMLIPEDRDRAGKNMQRRLSGEKFGHTEYTALRKDGSTFPVIIHSAPIVLEDKTVGLRGVVVDITERKQAEEVLKESESKLRKQKMALEQKNIALREIVAQIEIEKNRIKEDIATNVNELLLPILAKLKMKEVGSKKKVGSKYVDLLKHHLQELASPFGRKITKKSVRLTPREIEMCALIKGGLTSKETAKLLSLSYKTVEKHRRNIRRKLGIANKNVNLASFLNTL